MIAPETLRRWAEAWQGKRVLVVGDLMLDEYIVGTAERLSPEAPVPVILCERRDYGAGGAANTARNLKALGAQVSLCGVIGKDGAGEKLSALLTEAGIDMSGVLVDPNRPTTVKTRIIAHHQQVARIDTESRAPLNDRLAKTLRGIIREVGQEYDGVLFSDYAKGVVTGNLMEALQGLQGMTLLTGAPKPLNLIHFQGFDLLCLNRSEASAASGTEKVAGAGKKILNRTRAKRLVITLGGEGCALFQPDEEMVIVPALRVQVYDIAGAGDTFLAAITLALIAGADFEGAAKVATVAAAAVVRKVGVATASVKEMIDLLTAPL